MPSETRSARVHQQGAREEGATAGEQVGMIEKERQAGLLRARCHFHSSSFFLLSLPSSPPFRPVSLSTIRYISTHPRHCFRGISSELFARDSFRVATRRLILLQCLLPIPSRSRCYETNARTIENSTRFVCAFLNYQNRLNGSVKLREIIKYERDKKYD